MTTSAFSRRKLLAGAGGAAALIGSGSLTACGGGGAEGSSGNAASVNAAVGLPTYVPYTGLKPDLPGTEQGVDPAFRNFPQDNPKSVPEKPGYGRHPHRHGEHLLRRPAGPGPQQLLEGPQRAARRRPRPADGQQRRLPAEVPDDHRRQRAARHAAGAQRRPAARAEHAAAARQAVHQPHRAPLRRRGQGLPQPGQHPHPHAGRSPSTTAASTASRSPAAPSAPTTSSARTSSTPPASRPSPRATRSWSRPPRR